MPPLPGLSAGASAAVIAAVALGLAFVAHQALLAYARTLGARTRRTIDDLLAAKLAMPIALAIAHVGLVLAAGTALATPEATILLDRVLPSGLIAIGAFALARVLLALAREHGPHVHHRALLLVGRFASFFIAVFVGLTLLAIWDVEITPLLASAGIIGIALALAAQESLANVFAGIAVYLDRMYNVGDYVVLDQGERSRIRGEIVDVGLRSTRIRTVNDVEVVIPNSDIANSRLINESARARHRIHVTVHVAHSSDLDQVEEALHAAARACQVVLHEPAPRIRFREIKLEGVRAVVFAWIDDPADRGRALHELVKSIHRELASAGIRMASPVMTRVVDG